ncbi:YfiR family protein [Halocola ammonii]
MLVSSGVSNSEGDDAQIDEANTVAMIKANYLFNFSKYSDWPDEYKSGKFHVGVYGDENVFEELLDKYATKSIGSQMLEVTQFESVSEIKRPHVLFVSKEKRKELSELTKKLSKKSTMIISDFSGALDEGVMINFVVQEGNIRFEINEKEADQRKIILGDKIKNWAIK